MKIACSRCGKENEPTRLFCSNCGAKLNLDGKAWREPVRWGRFLTRIVQVLILAGVGLLLWPVKPQGAVGGRAEAVAYYGKLRLLSEAVERRVMVVQTFSEAEVNAYLAEVLKEHPELSSSEGLSKLGIGEINLRFRPEGVTVTVVALWGPLRMSYEIAGLPRAGGGPFAFDVRGARWGHLPLPGVAAHWMVRRVELMFSGMERERTVLDGLQRVDVGGGLVRVATDS
ncbi:MAG TPA: zinc ribbon domain-containing protein [Kiritimatiellia bacterium]|nr:zinc ribbon domain-containing protein [Kiritimatiellia bacterium]HRZ11232.1 zinc ribbon domain-containing protein [Kiritimatiellia bacterium]HSA19083.1 zinc ribbon domain-containing protein [Kiritimatiellia bacterium]